MKLSRSRVAWQQRGVRNIGIERRNGRDHAEIKVKTYVGLTGGL